MMARTPSATYEGITACPQSEFASSPSLLSWANLVDSGEYIPKEALELEKDYRGFTLNSDFLINQCDAPRRSSLNGKREGRCSSGRGEWIQACAFQNLAEKAISPIKSAPPLVTHSRMASGMSDPHHTPNCISTPTIQTAQQIHSASPYACNSITATYVSDGPRPSTLPYLGAWESSHIGLHASPVTSNIQSNAAVQPMDPQSASLAVDSHMAAYMSIDKANGSNPTAGKKEGQKVALPKATTPYKAVSPSSVVAESPSDCLDGGHNAAAHNSEGAHHLSSYTPHEESKGQASPVKDVNPYDFQQFPSTILKDADYADTPTTELEAGLIAAQLQLPPLSDGPSIHLYQHSAEYRSLANATSETVWLLSLFNELGLPITTSPKLLCDNLGATHLTFNPVQHSRMKHIQIDLHFVRDLVQKGVFTVQHVNTHDQLADLLTKPLSRQRMDFLKTKSGLADGSSILRGRIKEDPSNQAHDLSS
ncbi:hypothetical protein F0562_027885 [Nyssa sinensis]|uniref:Reverse transcriptase Ty1/copia-type domain-containing protein n=1 Tax=Nyssa sinensis TaxID=561372 RepID=A0A5J5B8P5_9ASTE|nr:hypothetical protein F0562_027885 [Nyssa sinensis]